MNTKKELSLLRIYVSSTDKIDGNPAYETLIFSAKQQKLAGATAFRGIMGYGASSVIHSSKFWELTEKLPITVEIVDESEKIRNFFDSISTKLDKMSKGCLVTEEKVNVLLYKSGTKND